MIDTSVIVTGYPRSGTTTMMRMLHNGGMEVLADETQMVSRNEFAPYGSFEFENIEKELQTHDAGWTAGKAIKIVTTYMEWWPIDRPTVAIFMTRDMNEIVASLLAARTVWGDAPDGSVRRANELLKEYSIPTHYVNYRHMMQYPRTTAVGVNDFLDMNLDIDRMKEAVDRKPREKVKNVLYEKEPLSLFTFDRVDIPDKWGG